MESHHDRGAVSSARRITAHTGTTGNDKPQNRVGCRVFLDEFARVFPKNIGSHGQPDLEEFQSTMKPSHVGVPTEGVAFDNSHCLEEPVAVDEAAIENRNAGLVLGNKTSIQKNLFDSHLFDLPLPAPEG
jgi:hypothetical protein